MKILIINTEATLASPGRIACQVGKVMQDNGNEVIVAYGRGAAPTDLKSIKIESDMGVKIHALKTRVFDNVGFNSKKATIEFIKKVKEFDPDVVHLHNLHGYYINIEVLFEYLEANNKKIIWTLHDCWSFTGHCPYFDHQGCYRWKTGCFDCPQKGSYPASKVFDKSKQNYEIKKRLFTSVKDVTIVTPSEWLGELVRESFLGCHSVKVINNGVNLDVFKPLKSDFKKKHNIENKKIILGVASIWEKRKGLSYFLDLDKEISDEYKIIMVGLTQAQKDELPKSIIGITRTSNLQELAELYSISDVFFNPTLEDNFPTVNLEALACGTPVATFKTGGSPEIIDENSGVIVLKNDLLTGIKKAIEITEKGCLERVKRYSTNICLDKYLELLN